MDFRRTQLGIALAIGVVSGAIYWGMYSVHQGSDFLPFHFAARTWLSGKDGYAIGLPVVRGGRVVVEEPFFYPFPALLALAPFAWMSVRAAGASFIGLSSAVLAYGVARRSPDRFPLFLGAGFLVAAAMGQWSPFITATLLIPALAPFGVIKPNVGLAMAVAKPTALRIIGGALLLVITLAFQPTWPMQWIHNLRGLPPHPPPIAVTGGALALLGLSRWRRPEARLIVAMACVPQLMYFADQLPLWLVARTRREAMFLSVTSLLAWAAALFVSTRAGLQPALNSSSYVLAGVYFPALLMVLRRPNAGRVPAWLENVIAPLPTWVRGRTEAVSSGEWSAF